MALHTVRKEFSFDAAHRLVRGYDGKCAHLHGHTWRARFEISAPGLSAMGFVRDFSDFKVMKTWIDHLEQRRIPRTHRLTWAEVTLDGARLRDVGG